jgi:hypothetical protein
MPMPVAIPTPMLYGVKCTEVSQRAYSGQTSAMKSGFDRLQRLDSGKVEYRTIGKLLGVDNSDDFCLNIVHPGTMTE